MAIFAALPQEYRTFKRLMGGWTFQGTLPFKVFQHQAAGRQQLLVETGMSRKRLLEAVAWALKAGNPDVIISAGFAGGLQDSLGVGKVVWGETFSELATNGMRLNDRFQLPMPKPAAAFCQQQLVDRVRVITVERPVAKARLNRWCGQHPAVIDMESSVLAEAAFYRGIPFICLRAVSDGLHDEIDYDLEDITDDRGRVRIRNVLRTILNKPALIRSFHSSWRRARLAARHLARALAALLTLPQPHLEALVQECRLAPLTGTAAELPPNPESSRDAVR
jgi:adenosylhomocysteine nucleosidase